MKRTNQSAQLQPPLLTEKQQEILDKAESLVMSAQLGPARSLIQETLAALPKATAPDIREIFESGLRDIAFIQTLMGEIVFKYGKVFNTSQMMQALQGSGSFDMFVLPGQQASANAAMMDWLDRAEKGKCPRAEAMLLNFQSAKLMQSGEYLTAITTLKKATERWKSVGGRTGLCATLQLLSNIYSSVGEKGRALESLNFALKIYQQMQAKNGESSILVAIGAIYARLGEKIKALEFYNVALPIIQQSGNRDGEANTLNFIGSIYQALGENAKALEFCTKALVIIQQVGNRFGEAVTLNNIGLIYDSLNEKTKSLDFFNRSLEIHRQFNNKNDIAATLSNIGAVYSDMGETSKALLFLNQALYLRRQVGNKPGEANTLYNIGVVYDTLGESLLATTWYKGSATLLQQLRGSTPMTDKQSQQTFLKENENTYIQLTKVLNRQNRTGEAQQVYLLTKLRDVKKKESIITPDLTPLESNLLQRYNQKAENVGQLSNQLTPLTLLKAPTPEQQTQIKDLEDRLKQVSDEFFAFLEQARQEAKLAPPQQVEKPKLTVELYAALQSLQNQTKKTIATVLTIVADDSIAFMVIKDGKTTLRKQTIPLSELNQLILRFKIALTATNGQGTPSYDPKPLAQKLYDILIKPIQKDIANCQQVFWMLDGKLRYIPLAALHDGKAYLVQGSQHHTLLSAEAIGTLPKKPSASRRLLALATSAPHTTEEVVFPPLPGVPQELAAIKPTKILSEAAFTKSAFLTELKRGYSIVHLATHFALRPGDLYNSFVLLGDGSALRLSEINDLPDDLFAGVDLLTLSACDTGSGATSSNGAELEGLSLVAQRKGAAAVLSTLWPVNDSCTAALMGHFYANRSTKSKIEALRLAQLALLQGTLRPTSASRGPVSATGKSTSGSLTPFAFDPKAPYAHPYYWAAFTLSGNPR